MRVPKDPLAQEGCQFEDEIYAIIGSVYGLCNSPRLWFAEVRRRLIDTGWTPHPLDPALFIFRIQGQAVALCGFHVDDCIVT